MTIAETTAPEQLVCKRIPRTGSIAGFERKCMSKSDWERASSESRTLWTNCKVLAAKGAKGLSASDLTAFLSGHPGRVTAFPRSSVLVGTGGRSRSVFNRRARCCRRCCFWRLD